MRPKSLFTAWILVLALLFGQVGLSLLHTHQGQPAEMAVALSATADGGATICKACAIDGMPVLYVEPATTLLPEHSIESFGSPLSAGIVLSSSSARHGRAPPVC